MARSYILRSGLYTRAVDVDYDGQQYVLSLDGKPSCSFISERVQPGGLFGLRRVQSHSPRISSSAFLRIASSQARARIVALICRCHDE